MEISRKAIGLRIRALRNAAGLSQREFAESIKISNKTLSSYENGDSYPSPEVLARIAKAHGKNAVSLIFFGATMPEIAKGKLTAEEMELIQNYRQSAEADRQMILRMAELAAKAIKSSIKK
jgi:transcriptional regulator with XRE-family HTH domain